MEEITITTNKAIGSAKDIAIAISEMVQEATNELLARLDRRDVTVTFGLEKPIENIIREYTQKSCEIAAKITAITFERHISEIEEMLKQIEIIEAMQLDTRTECFMQLQQVKKLKELLPFFGMTNIKAESTTNKEDKKEHQSDWQTDMPEFYGDYLCKIEKQNECGTTSLYQQVCNYRMNVWTLKDRETVVGWKKLIY